MTKYGLGVMIHRLSGGSERSAEEFYGKKISAVEMHDERVSLTFADGPKINILDDGQSCCEARYMTTDDDLSSLIGNILTRIELKDARETNDDWVVHEQLFLEIGTDQNFVTIVNHNEHNGYYGGFAMSITLEDAA